MEQPSGSSKPNQWEVIFNFADLCFICLKKLDKNHKKVLTITNDESTRDRLIELCEKTDTAESYEIKRRIESVPSLVGAKAQYHKQCYTILSRVLYPKKYPQSRLTYEAALQKVFKHIIHSNRQQYSLDEFKEIMGDQFCSNETLYTALENHFGSDLSIVHGRGKQPKFLYKQPDIGSICIGWSVDEGNVSVGAQQTVLKVAASILVTHIKNAQYDVSSYPPPSQFLNNVTDNVPSLLSYFLEELIPHNNDSEHDYEGHELKKNTIAHSIISISRPRSFISTLQLAVGTYVYRKSGSKLIIDLLSKLGVSPSYKALQLYEASTIIHPAKFDPKDSFVQYVFDNTDYNVSTLDGKETFHCLGGIAIYTPSYNVCYEGNTKKLQKMPVASTLAQQKQIRTIPYSSVNKSSLVDFKYKSVSSMNLASPSLLPRHYGAYIWAKYLQVPKLPSWRGFMEVISRELDHCTSHIVCLPFINEPPSNLTTLNTSLHYALDESLKQKQRTCFVTYDQPLYLKARSIVLQSSESNFDKIVVRLGGFHLLMSYLGAIGHIMAGSGLDDLWSIIYAQQSTKKMMSGQAYSRSVRAHILTFTALGILVCEGINSKKEQAREENEEGRNKFENYTLCTNNMKLTFSDWQNNPPLLQQFETDNDISILTDQFTAYLTQISKCNPTAELWKQYIESVSVALQFIEAERLGNWELHLQSVKKMLPLFHASGHFAYAKSAQMYLQDMIDLELKMDPIEYDQYTKEGFFTIRRSDKAWSGVWSDMTIEQTLNRFFGTDLKHGRGVTPSVVARYSLRMPAACSIMENLENYTNLKTENSEQHTDLSHSKMDKDEAHITCLLQWLRQHNPFAPCMTLISLSTGVIGNNDINCHKAYEVGEKGMATMVGKNPQLSLSKLHKVRNLLQAKSLHIEDTCITINPLTLFQRIHVVIQQDEKELREAFQYELSLYPLALFDDQGLMHKTAKAQLYKLFEPYGRQDIVVKNSPVVIDGGWLLHQVVWPHSRTFGEIFELYYTFLQNHYGKNVTVVFDGYYNNIIGVKSYERYRRKEITMGADICIVEDNVNTLTQTKFLSNIGNKVKLVAKLLTFLRQKGVRAEVAAEDADCLIVDQAVKLSESTNEVITIVGNDVDLLILLVALAPETHRYHFLKIGGNKSKDELYSVADQKAIKSIILFAHAFAGCDSTSALYKKGKNKIVKLLKSNMELKKQIEIFYKENESIENLYPVAEKIIYNLYHDKKSKSTDMESLRYECYKTAVRSSKTEVLLATLPPTKSALMEHIKRVYYQIQLWLGRTLNPEELGWKRTQMMLIPVTNPEKPAPEKLRKLIHCGCSGDCATRQCSCRKSGLECNNLCKQCNGESCSNRRTININTIDEDSEDEDDPEPTNDNEEGENEDNDEPKDDSDVEDNEEKDENETDGETRNEETDDENEGVRSDDPMDVDSSSTSEHFLMMTVP